MIFRLVILFFIVLISMLISLNQNEDILGITPLFIYPFTTLIICILIIWLEIIAHKAKGRRLFFASVGILLGLIIGWFLGKVFLEIFPVFYKDFKLIFMLVMAYVGFTLAWLKEEEMKSNYMAQGNFQINDKKILPCKILDTSVIIDGRIADITEVGFLEGDLIVPKFVLNELQQVADSSDPLKRSRGRRGLDILNNMKASKKTIIKIVEDDFNDIQEVDSKLLKLAHSYGNAIIVTNDFNLNKIAEFQGVSILNINELANAVKPILLPNEALKITVIKEGKDQNQGIAYLDDGTMIVIDNGKNYIGKEINVLVTSILQTPAGRMIFTQINDE